MRGLEVDQLLHELVILAVADRRPSLDVIQMIVLIDLAAELVDSFLDGCGHEKILAAEGGEDETRAMMRRRASDCDGSVATFLNALRRRHRDDAKQPPGLPAREATQRRDYRATAV